ncbi:hypothetical protein [Pseudomonas amygdali]
MNPIQTRFSNVEALRHSEVDVQELKAHGQIEVGGKCYDIRAAANNDLTVQRSDKQMTMSKFFKKAGLSGSSGSQSDQIAQVLNEKARPRRSPSYTPGADPSGSYAIEHRRGARQFGHHVRPEKRAAQWPPGKQQYFAMGRKGESQWQYKFRCSLSDLRKRTPACITAATR